MSLVFLQFVFQVQMQWISILGFLSIPVLKTRRISSFKYLYAMHAYIRPSFSTFPLAGAVAKYSCPCGRDCKMSANVVRKISIVCLFVFFCNKVFLSVRKIIRLIILKCSTGLSRPIYMILVLYASKTEHPVKTDRSSSPFQLT